VRAVCAALNWDDDLILRAETPASPWLGFRWLRSTTVDRAGSQGDLQRDFEEIEDAAAISRMCSAAVDRAAGAV